MINLEIKVFAVIFAVVLASTVAAPPGKDNFIYLLCLLQNFHLMMKGL